jgi:hypothetical protein
MVRFPALSTFACAALILLAMAGTFGAAACAAAPEPPPYRPVANVKELMESTVQPAAEVYWGAVATIVTREGVEERFPKTDEEWEAVWGSAITIAESGNLMMMSPRAKEGDREWLSLSQQLVNIGEEAAKVALTKDPEAVLGVGEKVYDVCTRCHMKYIVEAPPS